MTHPSPAAHEETPALVEEEATSAREAPRHIQRRHPPQQILGDLNERVTRSKVTSIAGVRITGVSDPRGGGVNRVANRFLS